MGRGTKQRHFNTTTLPGLGRNKVVKGGLKLGSAFRNSNASSKIGRTGDPSKESVKSGGQMRSKNTIKRLEMYKQKAPNKRDLHRQQLKPQRIEPDRRWFGNTRTINQSKMQEFREELSKDLNDPYRVVLKSSKLPMSLLTDSEKQGKMDLLKIESYQDTFGAKKQRRQPKLSNYDLEKFLQNAEEKRDQYQEHQINKTKLDKQIKFDSQGFENFEGYEGHDKEEVFLKGTSKRIWRELYKVVDSSDVIIQVLDARDPMGTRCHHLEQNIKKNHPHKHVILLLNKCDLIPSWATKRWVETLRKEKPTLAFHASVTNPFGKSALIQLLRQFAKLMRDKKQIQVGLIGYPNVGKSSVINTLKAKNVCKAAPIPGETRVWQYIALTKKIYAIDCPGIVPLTATDFANDTAKVLKGVVRAEKLESPSAYMDEVCSRVKPKYLIDKYKLPKNTTWKDGEEFTDILAKKMGKLKRGGGADHETVARIVLYDWQRGRIPYFVMPEGAPTDEELKEEKENKKGMMEVKNTKALEKELEEETKKELIEGDSKSDKETNADSTMEDVSSEDEEDDEMSGENSEGSEEGEKNSEDSEEDLDSEAEEERQAKAQNKKDLKQKTVDITKLVPTQEFDELVCKMDFDDEDIRNSKKKVSVEDDHDDASYNGSISQKQGYARDMGDDIIQENMGSEDDTSPTSTSRVPKSKKSKRDKQKAQKEKRNKLARKTAERNLAMDSDESDIEEVNDIVKEKKIDGAESSDQEDDQNNRKNKSNDEFEKRTGNKRGKNKKKKTLTRTLNTPNTVTKDNGKNKNNTVTNTVTKDDGKNKKSSKDIKKSKKKDSGLVDTKNSAAVDWAKALDEFNLM